MDSTLLSPSPMAIEGSEYTRWSYATSDARLEDMEQRSRAQPSGIPPQTSLSPPFVLPPSPIETSRGVWEDDDGVYYASTWPPVQEYLAQIREEKRMLKAPSEIIFVLAALDVAHCPCDVAHWIFWPSATYFSTADRVTAIALHQPRLIKSHIPWVGSREYRWIINAFQEKYYYIHVLGRWYPTDYQPLEPKRRGLRSNGSVEDRPDMTINQFFKIVEDEGPSSKRVRRALRKADDAESESSLDSRRARQNALQKHVPTPSSESSEPRVPNALSKVDETRSSGRPKRKVTSSTRAPRIHSAINPPSPTSQEEQLLPSESPSEASSPTSMHLRNRSTSQSSEATIVDENHDHRRSISVESTATAVGAALSKKRKVELLEEADYLESQERRSPSPQGVTTRGQVTKVSRLAADTLEAEEGIHLCESSPVELRPKSTRSRTKSRKARA